MFNDILQKGSDEELKELLREAKRVIIKERARRFILEDLNNENTNAAKKLSDIVQSYRDKYGRDPLIDKDENDLWETEDEEDD
jgi:hypothetical protein